MKSSQPESAQATKKQNAEKPVSLSPLSTVDALRGLLQTKPMKDEKGKAKSTAKRTKKTENPKNTKA